MTEKLLDYATEVTWKDAQGKTCTAMKVEVCHSIRTKQELESVLKQIRDAACAPVKIISSAQDRSTIISLFLNCIRQSSQDEWVLHVNQQEIELCVDDRCYDHAYIVYEDRSEVRAEEFEHLEELP